MHDGGYAVHRPQPHRRCRLRRASREGEAKGLADDPAWV